MVACICDGEPQYFGRCGPFSEWRCGRADLGGEIYAVSPLGLRLAAAIVGGRDVGTGPLRFPGGALDPVAENLGVRLYLPAMPLHWLLCRSDGRKRRGRRLARAVPHHRVIKRRLSGQRHWQGRQVRPATTDRCSGEQWRHVLFGLGDDSG
ncbi:MAG: hypothetical protein KatS3mg061_0488 [Dehalococcoidia bacterium]|nr:MAG: hypothetical protein KatS3mg061_0488 [Dehalococcoidia bacterium]